MKKLALIALVMVLVSVVAMADSIKPFFVSVTPDGPGMYKWTYEVSLTKDDILNTTNPGGDQLQYFTIYDFSGYIAGSATFTPVAGAGATSASDWSFSSAGTGLTTDGDFGAASNLIPGTPDNAAIPNLSWSYIGAGVSGNGCTTNCDFAGNKILGLFSADSVYNGAALGNYTGATFEFNGSTYAFADNTGGVLVPLPEPTSIFLFGTGLAGLAGTLRKRIAK